MSGETFQRLFDEFLLVDIDPTTAAVSALEALPHAASLLHPSLSTSSSPLLCAPLTSSDTSADAPAAPSSALSRLWQHRRKFLDYEGFTKNSPPEVDPDDRNEAFCKVTDEGVHEAASTPFTKSASLHVHKREENKEEEESSKRKEADGVGNADEGSGRKKKREEEPERREEETCFLTNIGGDAFHQKHGKRVADWFSSFYAVNRSFVSSLEAVTDAEHRIDFDQLQRFYQDVGQRVVEEGPANHRAVFDNVAQMCDAVQPLCGKMLYPCQLRFIPILMDFPLFSEYLEYSSLSEVLLCVLKLSDQAKLTLTNWYEKVPLPVLERQVKTVQDMLTIHLLKTQDEGGITELVARSRPVNSALSFLKILYNANCRRETSYISPRLLIRRKGVEFLDYRHFSNDAVNSLPKMLAYDFSEWFRGTQAEDFTFGLIVNAFALDAANKALVMKRQAEIQQSMEARNAMWQNIPYVFFGRPPNVPNANPFLTLVIRRENLIQDALHQLAGRSNLVSVPRSPASVLTTGSSTTSSAAEASTLTSTASLSSSSASTSELPIASAATPPRDSATSSPSVPSSRSSASNTMPALPGASSVSSSGSPNWFVAKESSELRKQLKVKFKGEAGVDEGGVTKEFFQLLVQELFNPDYGMFTFLEDERLYWFHADSFEHDSQFELIGVVLGLAMYNGVILDVQFPLAVYKKLLDVSPDMDDLEEFQPHVARNLRAVLTMTGPALEELELTFSVSVESFGTSRDIPLHDEWSTDERVTLENREEYVALYFNWIMNRSIASQFAAFYRGFHRCCSPQALHLFRPVELMLVIVGSADFDFEALERVAKYQDGYTEASTTVKMFWEVVHNLDQKQKKQLLMFTTGSDRVPIKGLSSLQFIIGRHGLDSNRLPTAHTCYNYLLLPDYQNKEKLERLLKIALENAQGFGLQ